MQGSSDNNAWSDLYTATNDYLGNVTKNYDISTTNTTAYNYYRLFIVQAETGNPGLSYMQLFVCSN